MNLLSSILEFPTIKVKDIMVGRQDVCGISADSTYDEVIQVIRDEAHSRYPVYDEDLDNTVGFLHVKDLAFVEEKEGGKFSVKNYVKPPFFVYEHMKIQSVFDHMNRKKVHLALVKDENGLVVGIVTLEDIMEEIFGEIHDEHDDEELIGEVEPDMLYEEGLELEASTTLRDLNSDYGVEIPLNDNYSTLSGFILDKLGNSFPHEGNIIFWEGYTFELTKVVDYQIHIKNTSGGIKNKKRKELIAKLQVKKEE